MTAQERKRSDGTAFVHAAPRMAELLRQVQVIASSPVPMVLITGESGTGKQAVARMLHDGSPRIGGPFVELNCSAIPETLVESELFGHERGAFSDARERKLGLVEIADGGTLFLDEIGDLGLSAQAKLLTFLEQRTFRRVGATSVRRVDARVVAATNRDLASMVADRTMREDLYYRLNAITVHLPPLRERPEDIPALAAHFLTVSAREFGRRFAGLASETNGVLAAYRWPGNVRELRAVINRAALMHDDEQLAVSHLPPELVAAALSTPVVAQAPGRNGTESNGSIPSLETIELAHIRRVLDVCHGNRTVAAHHLGITRQTLAKRLGSAEDG
jgi:DNA-binding NtrC family response regulator